MNQYNYGVSAQWRIEPTAPAVLGERFLQTLEAIAAAAPEAGVWKVLGMRTTKGLTIEEARRITAQWVEENVVEDEDDGPQPEQGYWLLGTTSPTDTPTSLELSATVGGKFGDSIEFQIGDDETPPPPTMITYPLFRTALLTIIALWPSVWANAYAFEMDYDAASSAPGVPPHPYSPYHMPWLSYLSAPLTDGLTLPDGIMSERTPDGGLLMIAAEERLDPTNPDHMRRSRQMAEIMIERAGNH